jgi:molybdopterin-containing oxidoreductase family membrane subunit
MMDGESAVLRPGHTYASVGDAIGSIVLERRIRPLWLTVILVALVFVFILLIAIAYLFQAGVGIWGINVPVAWGFAIVNFVWWIGIGHAGTLISAFLLLLHQNWRNSINRFAEAMTIFAVTCAGLFPLLHLGRPWFFYWMVPYPNAMSIWPQFRSPLMWDFFAVSTYFTVSLLFWFIGLIPDLATLRDQAKNRGARIAFGVLAMGWRGSARHWERYRMAYLLLAGLATPLVVSVHSVVSLDFTAGIVPGWHSTIFPPYFVAGAIFSGFAMVVSLAIPLRWYYGLKDFITAKHLDCMAKLMLAMGLIVSYGYLTEIFLSWYSADEFEQYGTFNRMFGPYAPVFWGVIFCNVLAPQALWLRYFRKNTIALFVIAVFVNIGMWLERFMIVVISLHRDFMPSKWSMYYPTIWDYATFFGTVGLFLFLFFLFVRFLPMISITEVRELVHHQQEHKAATEHAHG